MNIKQNFLSLLKEENLLRTEMAQKNRVKHERHCNEMMK
jgi:hypothetical protein